MARCARSLGLSLCLSLGTVVLLSAAAAAAAAARRDEVRLLLPLELGRRTVGCAAARGWGGGGVGPQRARGGPARGRLAPQAERGAFSGQAPLRTANKTASDAARGPPPRPALHSLAQAALNGASSDPLGALDSYAQLGEAQRAAWRPGGAAEGALAALLESLGQVRTSATVEVVLVGFEGTGVRAADVQAFLEAAALSEGAHVLEGGSEGAGGGAHRLPVESGFYFSVRPASERFADGLAHSIQDAYEAASAAEERAARGRSPGSGSAEALQLSHLAVDELLEADHHESALAYSIYLLNPPALPRNYTYRYGRAGETSCPGSLFAARERYAWVDITAGPVQYGPAGEGEGVVLPGDLPRAAAWPGGRAARHPERLAVDLVALVLRSVRQLVAPPMARRQHLALHTEVRLVHVMDSADKERHEELTAGLAGALGQIEPLLLAGQSLELTASSADLGSCDACAAAYANALTAAAPPPGAVTLAASEERGPRALDSRQLHHDLRNSRLMLLQEVGEARRAASFGAAAGAPPPKALEAHGAMEARRMVLVYVFDMAHSREPLLMDGEAAAVAAHDQVVASRAGSEPAPSVLACGGVSAVIDPVQLPRDVLGALLGALYGVPPAGTSWGAGGDGSGGASRDFLWAVGRSPLGPLASGESLPFSVADPAVRNVLLSALSAHAEHARRMLARFQKLGDERETLGAAEHDELAARWNVLCHKLGRAARMASLHSFDASQYYLLSSRHELKAIGDILSGAAARLETSLECYAEARPAFRRLAVMLGAGAGLLYALRSRPVAKLLARSGLRGMLGGLGVVGGRKFD